MKSDTDSDQDDSKQNKDFQKESKDFKLKSSHEFFLPQPSINKTSAKPKEDLKNNQPNVMKEEKRDIFLEEYLIDLFFGKQQNDDDTRLNPTLNDAEKSFTKSPSTEGGKEDKFMLTKKSSGKLPIQPKNDDQMNQERPSKTLKIEKSEFKKYLKPSKEEKIKQPKPLEPTVEKFGPGEKPYPDLTKKENDGDAEKPVEESMEVVMQIVKPDITTHYIEPSVKPTLKHKEIMKELGQSKKENEIYTTTNKRGIKMGRPAAQDTPTSKAPFVDAESSEKILRITRPLFKKKIQKLPKEDGQLTHKSSYISLQARNMTTENERSRDVAKILRKRIKKSSESISTIKQEYRTSKDISPQNQREDFYKDRGEKAKHPSKRRGIPAEKGLYKSDKELKQPFSSPKKDEDKKYPNKEGLPKVVRDEITSKAKQKPVQKISLGKQAMDLENKGTEDYDSYPKDRKIKFHRAERYQASVQKQRGISAESKPKSESKEKVIIKNEKPAEDTLVKKRPKKDKNGIFANSNVPAKLSSPGEQKDDIYYHLKSTTNKTKKGDTTEKQDQKSTLADIMLRENQNKTWPKQENRAIDKSLKESFKYIPMSKPSQVDAKKQVATKPNQDVATFSLQYPFNSPESDYASRFTERLKDGETSAALRKQKHGVENLERQGSAKIRGSAVRRQDSKMESLGHDKDI